MDSSSSLSRPENVFIRHCVTKAAVLDAVDQLLLGCSDLQPWPEPRTSRYISWIRFNNTHTATQHGQQHDTFASRNGYSASLSNATIDYSAPTTWSAFDSTSCWIAGATHNAPARPGAASRAPVSQQMWVWKCVQLYHPIAGASTSPTNRVGSGRSFTHWKRVVAARAGGIIDEFRQPVDWGGRPTSDGLVLLQYFVRTRRVFYGSPSGMHPWLRLLLPTTTTTAQTLYSCLKHHLSTCYRGVFQCLNELWNSINLPTFDIIYLWLSARLRRPMRSLRH